MENNIFIPKKIKVGFQNRSDTYTQKLAYVIYYDIKGKLRKEASWNSWRDNKITPMDFDNVPISGFVLNKKVGGYKYSWNVRNTYVRVYDPRDFEFEISVPNLLYILENTSSIKGKGLEGEFVYGWSGTELVLVPTSSPDYVEMSKLNELRHNKIKISSKELILGATYKHKSNTNMIYMGRFDVYEDTRWEEKCDIKNKGKYYYFIKLSTKDRISIETFKSLGDNFIEVIDSTCVRDYAKLFESIEKNTIHTPIDPSKTKYIEYTIDEFRSSLKSNSWRHYYVAIQENYYIRGQIENYLKNNFSFYSYSPSYKKTFGTIEELFNELKPCYKKRYLVNGKFYDSTK